VCGAASIGVNNGKHLVAIPGIWMRVYRAQMDGMSKNDEGIEKALNSGLFLASNQGNNVRNLDISGSATILWLRLEKRRALVITGWWRRW